MKSMKMKFIIWNTTCILIGAIFILQSGCKKEDYRPTITDIDGNVYHTVTIGTQIWMVENLKTTKYCNGDQIPNVTDSMQWRRLTTGAYGNYDNDFHNGVTFGRLYNWYAVNDSRHLAPEGWHVPSDAEWIILKKYLTNNGFGYEGSGEDIAKSMASKTGWNSISAVGAVGNDPKSNNKSGFDALPGGLREDTRQDCSIGEVGYWWSTTEGNAVSAGYWTLQSNFSWLSNYFIYKEYGLSIRCVKN
jgi:uncharacterized protein (TIGR02145 family)